MSTDPSSANPGDQAPEGAPGSGDNLCPDCAGTGELDGQKCTTCAGTGIVQDAVGGA
ncbi:MAG: hypothetical protein ABJC62_14365 [Frankiaceae bacterium]|jgi:DnaJ-class molecular chaperone